MSACAGIAAILAVAASAAGDLGTGFGNGGTVTTAVGSDAEALALVLQPDGKLVAAGLTTNSSGTKFALARYDKKGRLDRSFGGGGRVTTAIGKWAGASALVLQPDGKLVAAGSDEDNFALVRYDKNGRLDRSFGSGGTVTTPIGPGIASAQALVLQRDGKLVAAGSSGSRLAIVRYDKNGRLDASFGRGGAVSTAIGDEAVAQALVLQPDGKLVAAGHSIDRAPDDPRHGTKVFALARYDKSGRLDRSFGSGGTVTTAIGPGIASAQALVLQPDGKLVAAGGIGYEMTEEFALVRYDKRGRLDEAFGSGGTVTTGSTNGSAVAQALALQPDGKLVAAGYDEDNFALVRYDKNGRLDRSFGSSGTVTTAAFSYALALVIQPDGKLVAAGADQHHFALARYDTNGRLDK